MEFRPYPKGNTRTIVMMEPLLESLASGDSAILCVDVAVLEVARQLLIDRGLWRTTYAYDYNDLGYFIPSEAEFKPVQQAILTFLEDTNVANCGQEIRSGLEAIAAAMGQSSGCCCGGGTGTVQGAGVDLTDGEALQPAPILAIGENQLPEGWTGTLEEYEDYKCKAANFVFDWLVGSLTGLSGLSAIYGVLGITGPLIAGLLVPGIALGPVAFVVLIAAIVAVGALSMAGYSNFAALASGLEANRDEVVCSLFHSSNTTEAVNVVIDELESVILGLGAGSAMEALLIKVSESIFPNEVANRLFTLYTDVEYAGADCSGCGEFIGIAANDGAVFTSLGGGRWQIDSPARYSEGFDLWESYVYADPSAILVLEEATVISGADPANIRVLAYPGGTATNLPWASRTGVYNEELHQEFVGYNTGGSAYTVRWTVHLA